MKTSFIGEFQLNSCDLEYLIHGEINHNSIVTFF